MLLFPPDSFFIGDILPLASTPYYILNAPMNITVFENQSAVFTCEANGSYIGWRVQGIIVQGVLSELYDDIIVSSMNILSVSNTMQEMVFPAKTQYNEVRIHCLTWNLGGSLAESDTALLNIQGKRQF